MAKPKVWGTSRYAHDAIELLGNSIRAARIGQQLTMEEAAERAGISRGLLRRIEAGDPGVSVAAAFEAAAVVGVPLFESDRSRLGSHLAHQREKLALMPAAVRARNRRVKDAF